MSTNASQGQQRGREEELGALWQKSGNNGDYFTGSVTVDGVKVDVVVFPNRYKQTDKHPDYRILKSRDQRDKSDGRTPSGRDHDAPSQRQRANDGFDSRRHEGHPSSDQRRQAASREHDDDIPF